MNRQEATNIVFQVLNRELIKPGSGSDTMARAVVDALGITDKPKPVEPERVFLPGFQLIGEMTHAELVEECVVFQRAAWQAADIDTLKANVIQARLFTHKERLLKEAKITPRGPLGLFGWGGSIKTDDDE